jgi:TRAP-type C4-dicarboxylate transport system substrate-binding protein
LVFAHHLPPESQTTLSVVEWADRIESESGGQVKFTFYPLSSLVEPFEAYPATVKGICDLNLIATTFFPSQLKLTSITTQQGILWPSNQAVPKIYMQLYDEFPEIRAEFEGLKLMYAHGYKAADIHHSKKLVRVPDDLKGMKLSAEAPYSQIIEKMGASPVALGPTDWHTSLERGVVEGILLPSNVVASHKIYPLVPYHSDVMFGKQSSFVIMNLDKWNSLPADVQGIIEGLTSWAEERTTQVMEDTVTAALQTFEEEGQTYVVITSEELELWEPYYTEAAEKWIEDREAEGLPARAVFEETERLIKEYSE